MQTRCAFLLSFLCLALWTASAAFGDTPQAGKPLRFDRSGDPLPPGAIARLGTTRLRHFGNVHGAFGVAFSPDGKVLASVGEDRRIRLWDAATGRPLRTLAGHEDTISRIAFAPTGKLLASASHDSTVRLWDTATGKELRQLQGPMDGGKCLAISPDGKWLAAAGFIHLKVLPNLRQENVMIGRTSTQPKRAPGIFAAISAAAALSGASTR